MPWATTVACAETFLVAVGRTAEAWEGALQVLRQESWFDGDCQARGTSESAIEVLAVILQSLPHAVADVPTAAESRQGEPGMSTVALTIDYSNGAHKHFSSIPWKEGLTILGAIQASEEIVPGVTISFGSDRVGHVLKLVIDGSPREDGPASEWVVWVNAKPFQGRLGTETSFRFKPDEREDNLLKPGDHVLIKQALVP